MFNKLKTDLFDPPFVAFHAADVLIAVERDLKLFGAHPFLDQVNHVQQHRVHVDGFDFQHHQPGLDGGQIEDVIDQR
ncbi:MAG: hypothetical protein VYE58_02280 [Pseudomonadota bacterium]|nr:hypothetical protein [Pseudomonadota bacterium]